MGIFFGGGFPGGNCPGGIIQVGIFRVGVFLVLINIYFFLLLKIFEQLLDLTKYTGEQKEQRHVVQSVYAKIWYYKDKVASREFSSYRS